MCVFFKPTGLYWPDGQLYNGIQYSVSESKKKWSDAKATCQQDGAALAIVDSSGEDQYLQQLCVDALQTYVPFTFVADSE